MEELIKLIKTKGGKSAVSARELHSFLEVGTDFTSWCKRMFEYGFSENIDYAKIGESVNEYVTRIDFVLLLDCAKEIAMIQRSEKGKQARQYFIACEKKLRGIAENPALPTTKQLAQMVIDAENEKERVQLLLDDANKEIAVNKPKIIFADAVSASSTTILVGDLAKLLSQNGIKIGQNRLFIWMRTNGYLISRNATDYNMPTQRSMELGLFEIKETSIVRSEGNIQITKTPKVTGKGQTYFINKFLSQKPPIHHVQ